METKKSYPPIVKEQPTEGEHLVIFLNGGKIEKGKYSMVTGEGQGAIKIHLEEWVISYEGGKYVPVIIDVYKIKEIKKDQSNLVQDYTYGPPEEVVYTEWLKQLKMGNIPKVPIKQTRLSRISSGISKIFDTKIRGGSIYKKTSKRKKHKRKANRKKTYKRVKNTRKKNTRKKNTRKKNTRRSR